MVLFTCWPSLWPSDGIHGYVFIEKDGLKPNLSQSRIEIA
ncbi:hypothetical protein VOA_001550 [Vibrio sp. RC586]|nr:hypothetical protein VOA_001550 [Vibrio sp. RC586]